jgi:endogenous inhibitor of DNA gyrase (YacG/DUF329 family)
VEVYVLLVIEHLMPTTPEVPLRRFCSNRCPDIGLG